MERRAQIINISILFVVILIATIMILIPLLSILSTTIGIGEIFVSTDDPTITNIFLFLAFIGACLVIGIILITFLIKLHEYLELRKTEKAS